MNADLVHHSDRGVQNVSIRYTERLAETGIEPAVSSVGDSYDNALVETIIGLCKTEVIHKHGPWRSHEAAEFATLEWVDWFNNRRLLEAIGKVPPAEKEAAYYQQLGGSVIAALLTPGSLRDCRGESGSPQLISQVTDAVRGVAAWQARPFEAIRCIPVQTNS